MLYRISELTFGEGTRLRLDHCAVRFPYMPALLCAVLMNAVLIYPSDAARLGYDVIIAEDAVGDRDIPGASGAAVTSMVMAELGDAFGTVVKSSEIK